MAEKISYWHPETGIFVDAEEEYTELFHPLEYNEEVGDYYRSTERRSLTAYVHDRTGLVTTNVEKFEEWLRKIEGRS